MLANMLARFAIGSNMLGNKKNVEKCWRTFIKFLIMLANIVSQTHMVARFAMDSNMLAN